MNGSEKTENAWKPKNVSEEDGLQSIPPLLQTDTNDACSKTIDLAQDNNCLYATAEHPSTSDSSSESKPKDSWRTSSSQKNLIVNYLPQYVNDKELHKMFRIYGNIESVRVMKDMKAGFSFGFGFVNFCNDCDGETALNALNGSKVGNKTLKVSYARAATDDTQQCNLYVSDLPRTATEEDVNKMFAPFGHILQLSLLKDKIFNIPRGVAFIRYRERNDALRAILEMNGVTPQGHDQAIKVRMALDYGRQRAASMASFRQAFNINQNRRFSSQPPDSSKNITRENPNSRPSSRYDFEDYTNHNTKRAKMRNTKNNSGRVNKQWRNNGHKKYRRK